MIRDVAASIRHRLLSYARAKGRPFNEVLQYFALDRFLYRLGRSEYRDRFVLKGALMLAAWQSPVTRPTRDIDLLGRLDNSPDSIAAAVEEICVYPAPEDGLRFDSDTIVAERIVEGANYAGVRVRFFGHLGKARIPMQIDVAFGDALVPGPSMLRLPAILGLPPAELQGYSRESAIAEKLQVMVALGEINSRMKDFYDVWLLANHFPFDGRSLCAAIRATFDRRRTPVTLPISAFEERFLSEEREAQWRAFVRRHGLSSPGSLREAVRLIAVFLRPVVRALSEGRQHDRHWSAGAPWR